MKRRAARVIVFLVLGAIVNVAVAWVCAINARYTRGETYWSEAWRSSAPSTWYGRAVFHQSAIGAHGTEHIGVIAERKGFLACQWTAEYGLPMKSMTVGTNYLWSETARSWQAQPGALLKGIRIPEGWRHSSADEICCRLPLAPDSFPFSVNTIFYAGVLWMVFAFPGVMRRRRRIKRGLCPACAYPVGASPVCTECGKTVTPRSVAPA